MYDCMQVMFHELLNFIASYLFILEFNPIPTEEITGHFNELRTDIVLLYELKLALATCDYELETLKHRYEVLNPGQVCSSAENIY